MNKHTYTYWKSNKFWIGKMIKHPEIMTQGKTLDELKENIKDAYILMEVNENNSIGYDDGIRLK